MATYAYWLARRSRFQRDLAGIPANIEVLVLPPGATPLLKYNDFGHSDVAIHELVELALDELEEALPLHDSAAEDDSLR